MVIGSDRVVYIGTTEDLYEVAGERSGCTSRSLGLQGRGAVRGCVVDRRVPGCLYAGTGAQGVLRSLDGGRTWSEANDGIVYRNVFSLAQHPVTGDLFAGTEPANVYRSADGGDSWDELSTLAKLPETREWTFPRPPHVAHIRDITLRAADPDDVFCAVEDGWLVRSRDRGRTWHQVRQGVHPDAHTLTFMPDDDAVVYAATGNFGYRSTDGGETFVEARQGMDRGYMAGIVVHPDRPDVMLTAAARYAPPQWRDGGVGADTAVYRSEDQGRSWSRVTAGLPEFEPAGSWSMAGDPGDADTVFVGLFDGRVWATEDGGSTFAEILHLDGAVRVITVAHPA